MFLNAMLRWPAPGCVRSAPSASGALGHVRWCRPSPCLPAKLVRQLPTRLSVPRALNLKSMRAVPTGTGTIGFPDSRGLSSMFWPCACQSRCGPHSLHMSVPALLAVRLFPFSSFRNIFVIPPMLQRFSGDQHVRLRARRRATRSTLSTSDCHSLGVAPGSSNVEILPLPLELSDVLMSGLNGKALRQPVRLEKNRQTDNLDSLASLSGFGPSCSKQSVIETLLKRFSGNDRASLCGVAGL